MISMTFNIVRFRPPRIAVAMTAVAASWHWIVPGAREPVLSHPLSGISLGMIGFVLMINAWWMFKRNEINICPTAETARLLTGGVYRYTRNPMYLGATMMLLGLALIMGSAPFYVVVIAYFLVINGAFCPFEEAKLLRTFGPEYAAYRAKVGRWL